MKKTALAIALLGLSAGIASSDGHVDPAIQGAMDARNAHMSLYGYNIGLLGGMARDQIPYDAEMASAAASNLAALAGMNQSRYWPEGSDTSVEGSRALPAIWESMDDYMAKETALAEATAALAMTAGDGLDALRAGIGPVGGSCGACHEAYRAPNN